jgi:16S rRNA (cytosine967-C5)-methyltransferase
MKKNERLQALTILTKLLQQDLSLSVSLKAEAVSPLTQEICFGVCRHYYKLEAIANYLLKKRPKELEVWVALLIGLYQLHSLNIPDYAVVKETVALLDRIKKSWAKGLVNAVLRNYCRKKDELIKALSKDVAFQYNHPQWLVYKIKASWPNDVTSITAANDQHPPLSLRVNTIKTSRADYLTTLEQEGIGAAAMAFAGSGLLLDKPSPVQDIPGFFNGLVSVQDEAAQLAASLLDLKPGQTVLDACCAPGGKTCHILELEPNLKSCVALDVEANRLKQVQENLDRLELKATLLCGDASTPSTWWDNTPFDRILLDAPCSATGVIRRHPDIKLLRTEDEVGHVVELQQAILKAMWPLLAANGLLLYATCSILPEENELQIQQFLDAHPDATCLSKPTSWGEFTGHGLQILPGKHNTDGFFYSLIQKHSAVV